MQMHSQRQKHETFKKCGGGEWTAISADQRGLNIHILTWFNSRNKTAEQERYNTVGYETVRIYTTRFNITQHVSNFQISFCLQG